MAYAAEGYPGRNGKHVLKNSNGEIEKLWKGARLARKAGDIKAAEVLETEARRLEGRA